METSITNITEGQRKQLKRFLEDAADKALAGVGLDKDGLQRVIENGDDLQAAIVAKLRELSVTKEYADLELVEEVGSNYGYLSGYKPNPTLEENLTNLERELKIIRKDFPELRNSDFNRLLAERIRRKEVVLPKGAERWTLIPRYELIAASYNDAVLKVLELIKKDRKGNFHNWLGGHLGPQYLRQMERAVEFWKKLGEEQESHDILVVATQFGLRHRGRSARRAHAVMTPDEFGLGTFAVGVMLLTHPERLKQNDDLSIDCAGDEYSEYTPVADCRFKSTPCFRFDLVEVGFDAGWFDIASEVYGSASGFVSQ